MADVNLVEMQRCSFGCEFSYEMKLLEESFNLLFWKFQGQDKSLREQLKSKITYYKLWYNLHPSE